MYSLDYCQDGNNEFNNKYDTNSLAYKNVSILFVLVFYHNCISRSTSISEFWKVILNPDEYIHTGSYFMLYVNIYAITV